MAMPVGGHSPGFERICGNVFSIAGGWRAWTGAGLPITTEPA